MPPIDSLPFEIHDDGVTLAVGTEWESFVTWESWDAVRGRGRKLVDRVEWLRRQEDTTKGEASR